MGVTLPCSYHLYTILLTAKTLFSVTVPLVNLLKTCCRIIEAVLLVFDIIEPQIIAFHLGIPFHRFILMLRDCSSIFTKVDYKRTKALNIKESKIASNLSTSFKTWYKGYHENQRKVQQVADRN